MKDRDRRWFLRTGALAAAGILVEGCREQVAPTPLPPRQTSNQEKSNLKALQTAFMVTPLATVPPKHTEIPDQERADRVKAEAERSSHHYFYKFKDTSQKEKEARLTVEPFLYLPIGRADLPEVWVGQGWTANPDEAQIDFIQAHEAIDICGKYGTVVRAPMDGWYICSVQQSWRRVKNQIVMYEGKPIAYGGGISVEGINENEDRTQSLHLAKAVDVPFFKPDQDPNRKDEYTPNVLRRELEFYKKNGRFIRAGEPIGLMGYSGLEYGTLGKYRGEDKAPEVVEGEFTTWDPLSRIKPGKTAHVHWAIFRRQGLEKYYRDPTGLYLPAKYYALDGSKPLGKDPLVYIDSKGAPLAAA